MLITIPESTWSRYAKMSQQAFARTLREMAEHAKLRKYRKTTRGPNKEKPKRSYDPRHPHVSTARVLGGEKPP